MSEEIEKERGRGRHKESMDAHASASLYCLSTILCNKRTGTEGYKQNAKRKEGKAKEKGKKLRETDLNIQKCIELMEYALLQYSAQPFRDLPLSLGKLNLPNVPSV